MNLVSLVSKYFNSKFNSKKNVLLFFVLNLFFSCFLNKNLLGHITFVKQKWATKEKSMRTTGLNILEIKKKNVYNF